VEKFTALLHHVYSIETLITAFYSLNRKAIAGVDKTTWEEYERDLARNLSDLSKRLQRGGYKPPPVERIYVPKSDGKERPIGIPTIEDKTVQKAMVMVLSQIYEVDFKNFSYGFREKRSPHDALDAVTVAIETRKINWVLDADLKGFFDCLSHDWLIKFVKHRIADKRVIRLIKRWLRAGVLDQGELKIADEGTPQGGSVSPLLANIYLHYVLDLWVEWWRSNNAKGEVFIVRYADDFVIGFQYYSDAKIFAQEIRKRLAKYNLKLNEQKTRMIQFGRFAERDRNDRDKGKPETFDFLGFTHICGKSRKGNFRVKRHTIAKRMRAKLQELKKELRNRLHWKIHEVGKWLSRVLTGHFNFYGVHYNWAMLKAFRYELVRLWFKTLRRRSHRFTINWDKMMRISNKYLPKPRLTHVYPTQRLIV
jgi:group II intron reverse transcriptase/maturase